METDNQAQQPQTEKVPTSVVPDQEIKDTSPEKANQNEWELSQSAQELIKEGKLDEAVEKLAKALEIATSKYGELAAEAYKLYYDYADALLVQYENSQDNLFGDAVPKEVAYSDDEEDQGEDQEDQEEDQENQENEAMDIEQKEDISDLQIVWETLESCRVILTTKVSDNEYLLKTYRRLGDVLTWQEQFDNANEEYKKALDLLDSQEEGPSRKKAEIYFLMGNNLLSQQGKEESAVQEFVQALEQLNHVKSLCEPAEAQEIEQVVQEIQNKIEDAREQQQSLETIKNQEQEQEAGFSESKLEGEPQDLGILGKRQREHAETNPGEEPSGLPDSNETKKLNDN